MKSFFSISLLLFSFSLYAQRGRIVSGVKAPKAGQEIIYYYTPPAGLKLPARLLALVAYENGGAYFDKAVYMQKAGMRYSFRFTAPANTALLLVSIADGRWSVQRTDNFARERKFLVDNNAGEGYRIDLLNPAGQPFDFAPVSYAALRYDFTDYSLQLAEISRLEAIRLYEDAYAKNPSLKMQDSYTNYLLMLQRQKQDTVKTLLLEHAAALQVSGQTVSASALERAMAVYNRFAMQPEADAVKQRILSAYPNGELAKKTFMDSLDQQPTRTETSILADMQVYMNRFGDSSAGLKEIFYKNILGRLINENQLDRLSQYEKFVKDTAYLVLDYNYYAWKKAGKGIYNDVRPADVKDARLLSGKAMKLIRALQQNPAAHNDPYSNPDEVADMVTNTYAAVLYREGQFDSAWYYQRAIYNRGQDHLDTAGLARLAVYTEKSKGTVSARNFLEEQLLRGQASPGMEKQLSQIYVQLHLPPGRLDSLRIQNDRALKIKANQEIIRKLGSLKAPALTLNSLDGNRVNLSGFPNKTLVLDFWASWCDPCKQSHPFMQELVKKYEQDTTIVFLFIDTWEYKGQDELRKWIKDYLQQHKYSFTVLLDDKSSLARAYKLRAIPSKVIISRNGNISFLEDPDKMEADITDRIEAEKRAQYVK